MWSKNPKDILIVRPLRDGVISEYEITARMLDYLIKKAHEQSWVPVPRPRVVVGIPSGVHGSREAGGNRGDPGCRRP